MIIVITGNGKGKTTGAIGTAIRGSGWGFKVAYIAFDKGGSHYGEQPIFDFLQDKIDVFRFGLPRFDEHQKTFRFENTVTDKEEAIKAIQKVLELYADHYFSIVCDEVINCMNLGLLEESDVKKLIDECPQETHLILTGRNAPDWLIEKADLVSE
ncbi:cob(I)yrinic acid a,c-diamide adenosyltransferase, partial [Candidatus Peregrinibacteria bacterium CG_4_10_14_0_2_um_filter_43_11]